MPSSEDAPAPGEVRSFWARLSVFCAVLAVGWLVLERGLGRMPNAASIKRDRLHAMAAQIDTIILGGSETYYGISPHALSGTAFNLANWSQSLYFDHELTKKVLPDLPRLERAIVLVNYMSLYMELYDHPESQRQYQYVQEWGIPLQRPLDYLDVQVWSRVARYSPHSALEELQRGFHGSLAPRVDDRGWYRVPDEDRWGLAVEQAHGRLAVHHGFMKDKYVQGNTERLEQLITLLRNRGVEVVLVTTPVWETYRAGMRQDRWSRTQAVIEAMVQKYGVRYLNHQNEPRMTADDFEDADHLNADGAVKFAGILDREMGPLRGPGRYARCSGGECGTGDRERE
jgi:hypothetical protein